MPVNLYPMLFHPVYKDYLWGGDRIRDYFKRDIPSGIYAESWEISERDEGMSIVENGLYAGISFKKVIAHDPANILGSKREHDHFPLLIKILDAKEKLSVQVHPDEAAAVTYGGEAKSEMWYLLGEEDTSVFCGLKKGVSRREFCQAIDEENVAALLRELPVSKGDAIYVPGGTVHAINAPSLILKYNRTQIQPIASMIGIAGI